jgi:hypothetical protein
VNELDAAHLLNCYDAQLRAVVPDPLPEGIRVERDGPLLRFIGRGHGGGIVYRDLDGVEGAELDELIARQVRVFTDRGEPFEWKRSHRSHTLRNASCKSSSASARLFVITINAPSSRARSTS